MDLMNFAQTKLGWIPAPIMKSLERFLMRFASVRKTMDAEYEKILGGMEADLKPYRDEFDTHARIPEKGSSHSRILSDMKKLNKREESRWQKGFVSGAVYHGDSKHIDFLNKVYALNSQANPLHSDLWPSATKYEAEIVSMTANMLGGSLSGPGPENEVCGTVSSGGSESIMLAMKVYRDYARERRGITTPNMVIPASAHAAFDKASQYFGIKKITVPVGPDYRADVKAMKAAVTPNTICMVGSAPCFPHGVVDPIEELSEFARKKGIGFHTDACLGGFVLPWAEKLGYDVPGFDFRLPGVTSMSADTHKFGYAAKGTSVVLYRGLELRRFQFYTTTEWPGGMYFSPTFAGSRPGALSAACWAAMVSMGEKGYMDASRSILAAAAEIKAGIGEIPELQVMGDPLWVVAFKSDTLNIYRIMDFMTKRHWNLNGLHKPSCVHICVTLRHTQKGVTKRFLKDLREAAAHVRENPSEEGGSAPVYGMAASFPMRGAVSEMLRRYLDVIYRP